MLSEMEAVFYLRSFVSKVVFAVVPSPFTDPSPIQHSGRVSLVFCFFQLRWMFVAAQRNHRVLHAS